MLRSGKRINSNIPEKVKRGPYNKSRHILIKEIHYNGQNRLKSIDVIGHYLFMRKNYPTSSMSEYNIFNDFVNIIYAKFSNLSLLAKITIYYKVKSVVDHYKKLVKNMQSNETILKTFIKENFCITIELNNESHDMDTNEDDLILEEEEMRVQKEIVSLEEPEMMVIDND